MKNENMKKSQLEVVPFLEYMHRLKDKVMDRNDKMGLKS
jgi:hypothetical protein